MNDFVQSNLTEAKNVYVTGHSLGGALGRFHFRWLDTISNRHEFGDDNALVVIF